MLALSMSTVAGVQSQTTSEFWPELSAHIQFPRHLRVVGFVGSEKGENDFSYQQIYSGAGIGYQWKHISKDHLENNDPDKEHVFVLGGGYEYLHTVTAASTKYETRLALQGTFAQRPLSRLLVRDRNRVEFRWVDDKYSTRYRNLLSFDFDIMVHKFRLTPYSSIEVYYDGGKSSWNEEQYQAGIEWPYRKLVMLQTYYLRQHCTTCNPIDVNVGGLALNFYF